MGGKFQQSKCVGKKKSKLVALSRRLAAKQTNPSCIDRSVATSLLIKVNLVATLPQ